MKQQFMKEKEYMKLPVSLVWISDIKLSKDEKTPDKISGKTNKKRQEASYKNAYDIDVRSEKTFRALESTGCVREMIVIIHLILQYVM